MTINTQLIKDALRLAEERLRHYANKEKHGLMGGPSVDNEKNSEALTKISDALKSLA
jgi:hypothetical protein